MKNRIKKTKHLIEYVGLRVLVSVIHHIPHDAALALGWGMAWLAFHVARFRVRTAKARIREVFGTRVGPREIDRIAWGSWRTFILGMVDMVRAHTRPHEETLSSIENNESAGKILSHVKETGMGAIIAIPHMGSWELSAFAASAYGIPLFTLAARQKNRRADAFLNRMRAAAGAETLLRNASVLKEIIGRIRRGKVLAILPDLRYPKAGLNIRFLGGTANVAGGLGLIARQTGVPVFPTVVTRTGWKMHRCRVFDPIRPDASLDKQADARRITQAVFDIFDQCIMAEPEQWFWFNKRWLFDPLDATSTGMDDSSGIT